jgi:type II secretory pathway component PulM
MKKPPVYGDEEAKRIIERAAEIDAHDRQSLDASALRDIASQAGISPAAVDRALEEQLRGSSGVMSRLMQRRGLLIGIAILAAFLVYVFLRRAVIPFS